MVDFDKPVPNEGDIVKLIKDNGNTYSGEVIDVTRYHASEHDPDEAVYFEFDPDGKNSKFMCKFGYYDGDEYSWVRSTNDGGPEISKGKDCWEYRVQ